MAKQSSSHPQAMSGHKSTYDALTAGTLTEGCRTQTATVIIIVGLVGNKSCSVHLDHQHVTNRLGAWKQTGLFATLFANKACLTQQALSQTGPQTGSQQKYALNWELLMFMQLLVFDGAYLHRGATSRCQSSSASLGHGQALCSLPYLCPMRTCHRSCPCTARYAKNPAEA